MSATAQMGLTLDPGVGASRSDKTVQNVSPGLDLSLKNALVDVSLDYAFQAQVDEVGRSNKDKESQRIGAAFKSRLLDDLLGGATSLKASSTIRDAGDIYSHRFTPGYSRAVADLATLDLNYRYDLEKSSATAIEQQVQGYSLGLKGELAQGRLSWSGAWTTSDTYQGDPLTLSRESFKFRSDYALAPEMTLQLSSAISQVTHFRDQGEEVESEIRYGAGVNWALSKAYSLKFAVDHLNREHTGEEELLRSGTLSWYPLDDLVFSFNYGDQLVEGQPGVLLTTRLDLGRL